MAEKYDLIFSLGSTPITSDILKESELQIFDFPFDKICGGDFFTRMNLLLSGCQNFMIQKDIAILKNTPREGMVQYKDMRTGFIYPFDYNPALPVENNFPSVKLRYDKYIKNLRICMNNAKKILIVYIEDPTIKEDEETNSSLVIEACQRLKAKYPKKIFHLLYVRNDDDAENMKVIQLGKDAEKFAFNFYRKFSEMSSYYIDKSLLSTVFTDIKLKVNWRLKKILMLQKLLNMLSKAS